MYIEPGFEDIEVILRKLYRNQVTDAEAKRVVRYIAMLEAALEPVEQLNTKRKRRNEN